MGSKVWVLVQSTFFSSPFGLEWTLDFMQSSYTPTFLFVRYTTTICDFSFSYFFISYLDFLHKVQLRKTKIFKTEPFNFSGKSSHLCSLYTFIVCIINGKHVKKFKHKLKTFISWYWNFNNSASPQVHIKKIQMFINVSAFRWKSIFPCSTLGLCSIPTLVSESEFQNP